MGRLIIIACKRFERRKILPNHHKAKFSWAVGVGRAWQNLNNSISFFINGIAVL